MQFRGGCHAVFLAVLCIPGGIPGGILHLSNLSRPSLGGHVNWRTYRPNPGLGCHAYYNNENGSRRIIIHTVRKGTSRQLRIWNTGSTTMVLLARIRNIMMVSSQVLLAVSLTVLFGCFAKSS